MSNVILRT